MYICHRKEEIMVFESIIKDNYSSYEAYLASRKVVASPFIVSECKLNHPSSICSNSSLSSTHLFGEASLNCEVNSANVSDFSLRILSTIIPSKVLFRYDSDGPDHKNKVDYIPLPQQSVPTPHYHRFDNQGNLLAYQTEDMKDKAQSSYWKDIENAFDYFCQAGNIHANTPDDKPEIVVNTGSLPFDFGDDPTNGLNF